MCKMRAQQNEAVQKWPQKGPEANLGPKLSPELGSAQILVQGRVKSGICPPAVKAQRGGWGGLFEYSSTIPLKLKSRRLEKGFNPTRKPLPGGLETPVDIKGEIGRNRERPDTQIWRIFFESLKERPVAFLQA